MTVLVPRARRTPSVAGMLATEPVSASDWGQMARAHNWLKGQPRSLIPSLFHSSALGFADTDDYMMALRLYPSGIHHTRRWTMRATGGGDITYTIGALGAVTSGVGLAPGAGRPTATIGQTEIIEELSTLPTALSPVDIDFRFTVGEGDSWRLMDLSCWEMPRPYLTDAQGQSTARLVSGQPMVAGDVSTLQTGATNALLGHRVLGHWAVPYANGVGTTTTLFAASTISATFASVWDAPLPVLPRNTTGAGAATVSTYADVCAWVSTGGSGEIRTSTTSGGTVDSVTVTTTTPSWTAAIQTDVDAEDLSTATGLAGGLWDLVDLEFRATVGTLYVASAVVYEATT